MGTKPPHSCILGGFETSLDARKVRHLHREINTKVSELHFAKIELLRAEHKRVYAIEFWLVMLWGKSVCDLDPGDTDTQGFEVRL